MLFTLAFGSLACIAIYLLANMAYLRVLFIPEIAASEHASAQRLLNYNSLFVSVFLSRHLLCLAEYAT